MSKKKENVVSKYAVSKSSIPACSCSLGIQCKMKEYWTILDHFKMVQFVLLDNNESKSETNQIHMTDDT